MNAIMHATSSLESVRPLRNAERVHRWRQISTPLTDAARMERDAQIAAGVRWLDEFRRRPIPKHRALIARN